MQDLHCLRCGYPFLHLHHLQDLKVLGFVGFSVKALTNSSLSSNTSLLRIRSKCLKLLNLISSYKVLAFHTQTTKIIDCSPATGILYLTNNFLSGHARMRGKDNGRYPYNYMEMIHNIFEASNNAIEVCSNSVHGDSTLTCVDIRPNVDPC